MAGNKKSLGAGNLNQSEGKAGHLNKSLQIYMYVMVLFYISEKWHFSPYHTVLQARSQDFLWGSAYPKNQDQIVCVGMICHTSSEDTKAQSPTYR